MHDKMGELTSYWELGGVRSSQYFVITNGYLQVFVPGLGVVVPWYLLVVSDTNVTWNPSVESG